ncbi:hypothetical protein QJQ45_030502 [Haematococcus lacustris]|nr:hypothetical protein QJQ45_030502 [Haematococcus lacustris]
MSPPTDRPKNLGDMPYEILASITKWVTALPIARRFSRCRKSTLTGCLSTCKTLVLYIDAYSGFLRLSTAEAFRTRAEPVVLVLKRRGLWPQSDFALRLGKLVGDLGTCPAVHTVHITGELVAYDVIRNTELQSLQDLLSTSLPNCTALKVSSEAINIQDVTRLLSHPAIAQRLTHLDITTSSWTGDNNSGLSAFVKSTLNLRALHVPTLDDLEDTLAEQVSMWDTLHVDTMHWATLSKLPAQTGLVSIHIKRLDGSWGGEDESMEGFYAAHVSHQLVVDELRMDLGSYPLESPITPVLHKLPRPCLSPSAESFAKKWEHEVKHAQECMRVAQDRQQRYANKRRRDVTFSVGDSVLLSTKNLRNAPGRARKFLPRQVRFKKRMEYLVKWTGYDDTYNTWEPEAMLAGAPQILSRYKAVHNLP